MGRLLVKKLHPDAKLPTVAYPGEDLGYDIYALEDTFLESNNPRVVKTGIAARYIGDRKLLFSPAVRLSGKWVAPKVPKFGLEVSDRSGMATKNGVHTVAGIIDAGYEGEIGIAMVLLGPPHHWSKEMYERTVARHHLRNTPSEELLDRLAAQLKSMIEHHRFHSGGYPAADELGYQIKAGDKIAQLLPRKVYTGEVVEVDELPKGGVRGGNGYGSSGR